MAEKTTDAPAMAPAQTPPTQGPTVIQGTGENHWINPLWSCFTPTETCFFAWCLPCFLFGKTSARLDNPSLPNFSYFNTMCGAYCCLLCTGGSFVLQTLDRAKLRRKYGMDGSTAKDFVVSFCCPCCALVQMDKEAMQRAEMQGGYQRTEEMAYP